MASVNHGAFARPASDRSGAGDSLRSAVSMLPQKRYAADHSAAFSFKKMFGPYGRVRDEDVSTRDHAVFRGYACRIIADGAQA
jgi:hypothetical protein